MPTATTVRITKMMGLPWRAVQCCSSPSVAPGGLVESTLILPSVVALRDRGRRTGDGVWRAVACGAPGAAPEDGGAAPQRDKSLGGEAAVGEHPPRGQHAADGGNPRR